MNYRNGVSGAPKCADPVPATHVGSTSTSANTKSSTGGIGSASINSNTGSGSGYAGSNSSSNSGSGSSSNGAANCNSTHSGNANYTSVNPASSVAAGAHAATERVKSYLNKPSEGMFANKKQCLLITTGMVLSFLAGAAALYMLQRYEESLEDKPASPDDRNTTRTFSPRRTN